MASWNKKGCMLHLRAAAGQSDDSEYALERVVDIEGVADGEIGDCDALALGLADTDGDAAGLALPLTEGDVDGDAVGVTVGVANAPEKAIAMQHASTGCEKIVKHEASVQSPNQVVEVPLGVKTTPLPSPPVGSLPAHSAWPAAERM